MTEHKSNFPEFYITAPQPCPYLPGRLERKLFTHLTRDKPRFLVDNLLKGGFRRSQNIAYMPYCDACSACVPVRILVDQFHPRRSLRRIARANRDLVVGINRDTTMTAMAHLTCAAHTRAELVEIIGSSYLSIVFYVLFKVCERVLIERLTGKPLGEVRDARR